MAPVEIPHLVATEDSKQLVVNGEPFLMLAAELQNSSLSSVEYMSTVWQHLVDANINTVLGSVTWETIEPVEGQFFFEELDKIIQDARSYGLRLVLLWFGSFKNGVSTYVPSWVKVDAKRFPRAKVRKEPNGLQVSEVLSVFNSETLRADACAFKELMSHLKEIDEEHSTVIMVQVENEPGLIGDSRDASEAADHKFQGPVPAELLDFLSNNWDTLHDDLKKNLSHLKERSSSNQNAAWEATFGKGPKTDELFMAYHYARFTNEVAAAGRKAYPLPLFTNVWLNSSGEDAENDFPDVVSGGGDPGKYPSGGAVPCVLDIWQNFAPQLDFISPDIYLNDYPSVCAKYRHHDQPLFIPEQRRDEYGARRIWVAIGSHAALGVSPFGIDTLDLALNPYTKHYGLLSSISKIICCAQKKAGVTFGFFFDEPVAGINDRCDAITHRFGQYELTIERCFVFGKPGPGAGMIIYRGEGRFLLIGWGFQVTARSLEPAAVYTGILRFEGKQIIDSVTGEMVTGRVLNGDETRSGQHALMPNEDPDYGGFPVAVTIPARTMIAELEVYHLT